MSWAGRWKNGEAFCLASGPSLTKEDVDRVIAWRDAAADRYVLVCNTTFKMALTADALFSYDRRWWTHYGSEVMKTFKGHRFSSGGQLAQWQTEYLPRGKREFPATGNSGAAMIVLSVYTGCTKVYLLGYDCQRGPNGEVHHHGNHPRPLGNALSMPKWPVQFQAAATYAKNWGVEVVNCSRRTALTCFPRADLEEAIAEGLTSYAKMA